MRHCEPGRAQRKGVHDMQRKSMHGKRLVRVERENVGIVKSRGSYGREGTWYTQRERAVFVKESVCRGDAESYWANSDEGAAGGQGSAARNN
uniref:DUF1508 domain-containing protein n=1 Tax=Heterorhabditis bacteriophora TaxID=37862 RepID=A0A1I7WQI9_HETBA